MGGSGSELPSVGSSLALSFVSLGLICVAAYWVLRWLGRRGVGRPSANIRIVGRCCLEPRRSVYLVEAAGRCFLVGVGDGPISLIAEVERGAVAMGAADGGTCGSGGFGEILSKALRRRNR
jgi:flagellar biosynthetic protein FliO